MNIEKIHSQLLSSKSLLFTIIFAFVAIRLYPLYNQLDNLSLWGSLLIQLGIALFLLQLNSIFNIIQRHTFLPALFYLLFIGSNPVFFCDLKGSVAALCVVWAYYYLFNSYQKPKSQTNAMNISILLVFGSLFWPPLLFLFPIFWIGFYYFHCFNARMFFASLTGFLIVYLFVLAWSLFWKDQNAFTSLLPQFDALFFIQKPNFTIAEWLTCGVLMLVSLLAGLHLFFSNISERIWTIAVLNYFFLSVFILFIFYFLQSKYKSTWELINYVPIAFLIGHFFSRSNKRSVHYLLLFCFIFFILIDIAQLLF